MLGNGQTMPRSADIGMLLAVARRVVKSVEL